MMKCQHTRQSGICDIVLTSVNNEMIVLLFEQFFKKLFMVLRIMFL